MCGRYQSRFVKQRLAEEFHLRSLQELTIELAPNFNIAPTTMQPFIVADRDTSDRVIRMMRWDLIPGWVKSPKDITTNPNELTCTVHNRMPVILEPEDYTRWLSRADEEQPPINLLRPFDADAMKV